MTTDTPRHPGVVDLLEWFDADHLRPTLQAVVAPLRAVAYGQVDRLPDSAELTAGLRKLLEAKDCFVRAAIKAGK